MTAALHDDRELRAALIERYGAHHYRITSAGEVHVYSVMPNTNITGWWLMGDRAEAASRALSAPAH